MDKRKIVFVFVIYFMIFLLGCGQSGNDSKEDDLQSQIREESFTNDTQVGRTIEDVVEIKVDSISDGSISLTIKAPNIAEELFQWIDQIGDEQFDEQKFEEEIIQLLHESERYETILELQYEETADCNIFYTEEYMNVVSCGLEEFYNLMMQKTIEDIRGK